MDRANGRLACVLGIAGAVALGCGGGGRGLGSRGRDRHGTSAVGGQVVSTVDGNPITLAEVDALVAAGLSPREALKRLQSERLLAAEALRRGVAEEWAVSEVGRKAAVQALLSETANAVEVTNEELEAAFARQSGRFELPERRAAVHLLATVPAKAGPDIDTKARAIAERLAPELEHADDLDAFVRTNRKAVIDGVRVIVERLPPLPLHGRLDQAFADAMFASAEPGMVPQVVRSSYGWHAIRVTEIDPPVVTPKEDAFAVLRKELVLDHQKARVQEVLRQLAEAYPVKLSNNVAQTLNSLAL